MDIEYCPHCGNEFDSTPADGVNGYHCATCERRLTLHVRRWVLTDG